MSQEVTDEEKRKLTPESGFNLVGIDYFETVGNRLYLVEYFDIYQDALKAKKDRKLSDDYFILYKGAGGEYLCR
jgi:hypothetical protein